MSETVTLEKDLVVRLYERLGEVERLLQERREATADWIGEGAALSLLGCSKATLYRIKNKHIRYKAIGRKHQYSRKSIEKYIAQNSSL